MTDLLTLIVFTLCTASLAVFLDFSFETGEIFAFYRKGIDKAFNPRALWLYKILGGCVFCFGTWVFICTYLIFGSVNFAFIPIGIGLNYVWIKLLIKI